MEEVKHRRWLRTFTTVAVLLIAQVTWWAMIFVKDVRLIASLQTQNLELSSLVRDDTFEASLRRIQHESIRHQIMFLSESTFFALMACLGLYLLYRALKVEERSREIQRNFIEVVTHESKTPLTALKLRLESAGLKLSQRENRSEAAVEKEISLALEEVGRLASILEKALSLNRVERQVFRFEPLRLADVVRAVVHRLDPFLRANAVALTLELDADAVISGDPHGLQSLVQSLLENAVLYNHRSDKQVRVEIKVNSPKVLLMISDNGPGIDPQDQGHVFERFYRARRANSPQVPGTGLGLYIAKSVAEAHQGTLRLVDCGQSGARFEMELPEGRE